MGSINFNNFKNTNYSQKKHTYADLFLDLASEATEMLANRVSTTIASKDIKVAYDLNAIKNSLRNLFNTTKGDRYLLPEYGCDLRSYLFDQATTQRANLIGNDIKQAIEYWEPRVVVDVMDILVYEDKNEYEITLKLNVPFLKQGEKLELKGLLNKEGYIIR